jgi:hypothetical protein
MESTDPRRKFPRIFLVGIHDLKELIGARIEWGKDKITDVLDLSYTGAAVVRPENFEFEKGKAVEVQMHFAGSAAFPLQIVLVRETEKIFGIQFQNLNKKTIEALDGFLSDKILGRNLRSVNPKFFRQGHTFNHWLHGPNNTNLYLWVDGQTISQAVLELAGSVLMYEKDTFYLQKIDEDDWAGDEYVVFPFIKEKPRTENLQLQEFLKRALKVLSQVENAPTAIWALIDILKMKANL